MARRRPRADPAAARRQHHPVVSVLLLVVALFASLAVSADKRPDEHVVLADCRAGKVYSSQIAYFNGPPNDKPQDVAPVVTPAGETRLWPANTTTGFFSTTGTSFTAQLGPPVDLGGFAGTGFNNYTSYTCWRRYQANLYKYGGAVCAMSYDCTHEPMPNSTKADPDPKAPTGPKSPDGSRAPSAPGASNDGGPPEELSLGAMIGVIVGGVVGLAMLAGLIAFVVIQRRRLKRQSDELDRETEAILLGPPKLAQTTTGGEGTEKKDFDNNSSPSPPPPSVSPRPRHEVDGHWRGAEVHGAGIITELDGVYIVPELDARGEQTPVTATDPAK